MPFGDSHKQTSLHTGVAYTEDGVISVYSISSSMRHDPPAVWAHLSPVLAYLRELNPFGPTTQYRSKKKKNFLSTTPFQFGFTKTTLNFLEAGHRKGPADGIGAAIKRTADEIVAKGTDLPDGEVFYEALSKQQSKIKLFHITEKDISEKDMLLPEHLGTVHGTMKIHQVIIEHLNFIHNEVQI